MAPLCQFFFELRIIVLWEGGYSLALFEVGQIIKGFNTMKATKRCLRAGSCAILCYFTSLQVLRGGAKALPRILLCAVPTIHSD